jgi:uncharacterized protein
MSRQPKKGSVTKKINQRSNQHEIRISAKPQKFEIRKNADGSATVSGLAIVWNALSEDLGGFRERFVKGSVTESLNNNPDVLLLYSHDTANIVARVSNGSLQLAETNQGLRFTAKIAPTQIGKDLILMLEERLISKMSFGFYIDNPEDQTWTEENGNVIRTVTRATILELSAVAQPAYSQSVISLDSRSVPAKFRKKLKRGFFDTGADPDADDTDCDPDTDDDDCEDETRCACECQSCKEGACDACSSDTCVDEVCADDGCPAASETRSLRKRLDNALLRRLDDLREAAYESDRAWVVDRLKKLKSSN